MIKDLGSHDVEGFREVRLVDLGMRGWLRIWVAQDG